MHDQTASPCWLHVSTLEYVSDSIATNFYIENLLWNIHGCVALCFVVVVSSLFIRFGCFNHPHSFGLPHWYSLKHLWIKPGTDGYNIVILVCIYNAICFVTTHIFYFLLKSLRLLSHICFPFSITVLWFFKFLINMGCYPLTTTDSLMILEDCTGIIQQSIIIDVPVRD